jgi:hypothetical protein
MSSYCLRADVEAAWPPAAVLDAADDDDNGSLSPAEEANITRAIDRAASIMNAVLEVRYDLDDLADNVWCRDCNAALAAYLLGIRKTDEAPPGIEAEFDRYLDDLARIRDGQMNVPSVSESDQHCPTVTNFAIDLREHRPKVRRVAETSTGENVPSELREFPATD